MNTIVIWGAASGLGAAMVDYFHQKNMTVIAVARNPSKNPQLIKLGIQSLVCDATNQQQVQATVAKIPADSWVISTMGSFQATLPVDYIGHRFLIDALQEANIRRFLLVTSLGCGDSWQYLGERAKNAFGAALREKSLAESWLQTSLLDFTILRPGGLKNGCITGQGELSQHTEKHGVIHRSEVARLAQQLLTSDDSIGGIYQCVDPTITY